jgi:hypothetical protein|tara:strand:- start:367 stop:1005 length:639 start_codon:yes stop_codon:yes gene_type:complete
MMLYLTSVVVTVGCGNLKFLALKGTELENPPSAPIKLYVKEFPVTSKANVVDPNAALGDSDMGGGRSINALAEAGNAIMVISRNSRIEDLTRSLLRELRRDKLRVFSELDRVRDLQNVREVANPFILVPPEDDDAQLEISGSVLLLSKRVEQRFSQKSTSATVKMVITDLGTGKQIRMPPVKSGINMTFNSKELEEAIAILITTVVTQKTLF